MTEIEDLVPLLKEFESSVGGLRIEVEGWRQHTGSTGEFIMLEIDRLLDKLHRLETAIQLELAARAATRSTP
jgi:hypothetical protein